MSDKTIIIGTIVGAFILIFGAYFLISRSDTKQTTLVASYSTSNKEKPQVKVATTLAEFGKIKVSEQKSHDFTIENVGTKPLQLSNIKSSCMCTTGQIIYDGKPSEEFGMHAGSATTFEIAPGKKATVRVTYRPYQMPVSGAVEREVYVTTNDPTQAQLIFKVTANIQ